MKIDPNANTYGVGARISFPTGTHIPHDAPIAVLTVEDDETGIRIVEVEFDAVNFLNLMSRSRANGTATMPSPENRHRYGKKVYTERVSFKIPNGALPWNITPEEVKSLADQQVPDDFHPDKQDVSVSARKQSGGGWEVIYFRYGEPVKPPHAVCGHTTGQGADALACGRYVDADTGEHEGWHAGFDPVTGRTGTWSG